MDQIVELITKVNSAVNGVVWGVPMLILLVGAGIYLSLRTGFVQFRRFWLMLKETAGKIFQRGPKAEGDITPFQALNVAMGGTVGVGNIAGVATAIAAGGPGAVFWMWISGLVGMATKFGEVVLGQHYRRREKDGPMVGGPMTYIRRGLGRNWGWLAGLFCIFGALAALGIGNMVQANAVAEGMEHFGVAPWITGIVIIVAVGMVTIGGIKWIAKVAMFCVPVMVTAYMLGAIAIIVVFFDQVPHAFGLIVKYAFTPMAPVGGFAGAAVRIAITKGLARGVFSNEAGLGSAPMAHATAKTDHPARQGLWGIFEVFVDTIIMCTATALVIILTGVWTTGQGGATLAMEGFAKLFGHTLGFGLVTFCMVLTAYDTILAWCFYGETCSASLIGHGKVTRGVYRVIWLPFTYIGAVGGLKLIWSVSDTLNALMAIPNLVALIGLAGTVALLARQFLRGDKYTPPPPEGPRGYGDDDYRIEQTVRADR
jgi:AGCS family alanine or glycine:cation symporter